MLSTVKMTNSNFMPGGKITGFLLEYSIKGVTKPMAMKYTEAQLNSIDKSILVQLFLAMQEENEKQTKKLNEMDEKLQLIMEQLVLSKQKRFGRSSEKLEDYGQIYFIEIDGKIAFFNEAEAVCDLEASEEESVTPTRKKKASGKKEQDMSNLPVNRIDHYMSESELEAEFGKNGWKQLPDEVSKRYLFVPAKIEVEEHHVGVYASKADGHDKSTSSEGTASRKPRIAHSWCSHH